MGVEAIGRGKIVPIEWLRKVHEDRSAQAKGKVQEPAPPASPDPVEDASPDPLLSLSPEDRLRILAEFKSELSDPPDVRPDKVIEAKLRISTGYYNRDEIRREVLRSLLESMGVPATPGEEGPGGEAP